MADQLAFEVADGPRRIIPPDARGPTIRHAVLEDFATSLRLSERRGGQLKASPRGGGASLSYQLRGGRRPGGARPLKA
ncbi:hypothetical protein ACF09K_31090 [Streptomyces sp. NPDC014882]|uniref:hypothetical protein n=1 Tax=Streptomyces sp. NPDC014882 TaxID=3364927 RepID=UPI0036F60AAF